MNRQLHSVTVAALLLVVTATSCKREQRGFRVDPPSADTLHLVTLSDLHAGSPLTNAPVKNDYEDNAWAISQGQHLYEFFNCVGCHAHGGGDKGPALMDAKWIYGSRPEQVFADIVEGRPNGMPSYRGRIPDYQVWEIVAYVRSLSGLTSQQAAPGRDDHMQTAPPPSSVTPEAATNAFLPKSAEGPN